MSERFWRKVDKSGGPNACWEWRGAKSRGYGQLRINCRLVYAHRIAWELTNGPIPDGMHVLHRCDNPPCCNPAHHFLGSQRDNNADKLSKNRQARGERVGNSRLRREHVNAMRCLWALRSQTKSELARLFGVTHNTAKYIVNKDTWRD